METTKVTGIVMKERRFSLLLLCKTGLTLMVLFSHLSLTSAQAGHYSWMCSNFSFTQCPYGRWDWYPQECYPQTSQQCNLVGNTVVNQMLVNCQPGWSSINCSVPVCSSVCSGFGACTGPGTCSCLTSTGNGQGGCANLAYCSISQDCYPGTCNNSQCVCPPGFTGPNCEKILIKPLINACSANLFGGTPPTNKVSSQISCAAEGLEPLTTWVMTGQISKIEVIWTPVYSNPVNLPQVSYISSATVGITMTSYTLTFPSVSGTTQPQQCQSQSNGNCDIIGTFANFGVLDFLSSSAANNYTFFVNVTATIGGQKNNGLTNTVTPFNGQSTTFSLRYGIDLTLPYHCLSNASSPTNCPVFPIYLQQDITTNPIINPKFYGWSDNVSGVSRYHVELYSMQPNTAGVLAETGSAIWSEDINYGDNSNSYTCTAPGIYSIRLYVFDNAGNYANARKLFIYQDPSIKIVTDNGNYPISCSQAVLYKGISWIRSSTVGTTNVQLTFNWTNHFSSNQALYSVLSLPASAWSNGPGTIDDQFGMMYGQRSIAPLSQVVNGMVSYQFAYAVDPTGGGQTLTPPSNKSEWITLPSNTPKYTVTIPQLLDGYAIVVWVTGFDAASTSFTDSMTFYVDRAAPSVTNPNPPFDFQSIDQSHSSVNLNAVDYVSGIDYISYSVLDNTASVLVYNNTIPGNTVNNANGQRKRRALESSCSPNQTWCYCIPTGQCYTVIQQLVIDHCKISKLGGHDFGVTYVVYNRAGLFTPSSSVLDLGVLNNLPCDLNTYGLSPGAIAGIIVAVVVLVLLLLINVICCICGTACYARMFKEGSRISQVQHKAKSYRDHLSDNPIYWSRDDRNNAAGLSSAPASVNINGVGGVTRRNICVPPDHSIARRPIQCNSIYATGDGSDFMKGGFETPLSLGNISWKDIKQGPLLSETPFAVVHKAVIRIRGRELPVVTKALANPGSPDDVKLMNAKIDFMSQMGGASHKNFVRFIGAVQDHPDAGPIMVLELCQQTLADWLAEHGEKVTSDVLRSMLKFARDITEGVQQLHSQKIIHKRLAARNVLLCPSNEDGALTAKLIGFGPLLEDFVDTGRPEDCKRPIRWLAPETLESINSGHVVYNEKTDAWSYGVTLWEMFSIGQRPYPDHNNGQLKELLASGYRLPRPRECPAELYSKIITPCWNADPSNRPNFKQICKVIVRLRSGNSLYGVL